MRKLLRWTPLPSLLVVLGALLMFIACENATSPTAPESSKMTSASIASGSFLVGRPVATPPVPSGKGCAPGYWKNHTDSWRPTGYLPDQSIESVFSEARAYAAGSASLMKALSFRGGSGVEGAARILLRAAVASVLNASHPGVGLRRTARVVIADTNAALATGNRRSLLALASAIDNDNNQGCPLN